MPKAPMPCPDCGTFHGILLAEEGGGTGFFSGSLLAHDGQTSPARATAATIESERMGGT